MGVRDCLLLGTVAFVVVGCSNGEGTRQVETETPNLGSESSALDVPDVGGWMQWGKNSRHYGRVNNAAQHLNRMLIDRVYDPHVEAMRAEWPNDEGGALVAHYQAPLVDGNEVFMMFKTGTYVSCDPPGSGTPIPCGPDAWNTEVWNEKGFQWNGSTFTEKWTFRTDWKPAPNGGPPDYGDTQFRGLFGWEPVFHPAITPVFIYVPGAGGTVHQLLRQNGQLIRRINPFGNTIDPKIFVSGPITVDDFGNVYYNTIKLDTSSDNVTNSPWKKNVINSWLVKIHGSDAQTVSFNNLIPGAPRATDMCPGTFTENTDPLPWPPSRTARPIALRCGSQRPGYNVAVAVAPNGTIYTVTKAHMDARSGYLVALNPNLTLKWAASLKNRFTDGCGTSGMPANGAPGGCRVGTTPGVDPTTNDRPGGFVDDTSTASPTIAPDGSVFYGANTYYNGLKGHLMKFSATGAYLGAYLFGWDITPSIYPHDGTYSVVLKENHYGLAYCFSDPVLCQGEPEAFYITQLNKNLGVEWKFRNTETRSCERQPNGTITCTPDTHPDGFEWCVNSIAVDRNGTVFANAEDGFVYGIGQGGVQREKFFTQLALAAAYTPLSIGPDGKVYVQNAGHLFVLGQ